METASTPLSAKRTSQLHFFHDSAQHWVYLHAVCAQEPPKQNKHGVKDRNYLTYTKLKVSCLI